MSIKIDNETTFCIKPIKPVKPIKPGDIKPIKPTRGFLIKPTHGFNPGPTLIQGVSRVMIFNKTT